MKNLKLMPVCALLVFQNHPASCEETSQAGQSVSTISDTTNVPSAAKSFPVTPAFSKDSQLLGFVIGRYQGYCRGWAAGGNDFAAAVSGKKFSKSHAGDALIKYLGEWYQVDGKNSVAQFQTETVSDGADKDAHTYAFLFGFKDGYTDGAIAGYAGYTNIAIPAIKGNYRVPKQTVADERYRSIASASYTYAEKLGIDDAAASKYLAPLKLPDKD